MKYTIKYDIMEEERIEKQQKLLKDYWYKKFAIYSEKIVLDIDYTKKSKKPVSTPENGILTITDKEKS
jgi:hypothetical protein